MTKFQRSALAGSILLIVLVCLMGYVGDIDYCDQVILNMSQEQYDSVKYQLTQENGTTPTDRDIAHWWAEHHKE